MYRMVTVAGGLSLAASDHLHMEITNAAGVIIDEWSCCKAALVVCTPSVSLEQCSRRRPSDLVFGKIDRFDDRLGASRTLPNMRPTLGTGREPTITSRLQPHQTDEIEKAGSDKAAARLQSYPTYSDVAFYIARPIVMQA